MSDDLDPLFVTANLNTEGRVNAPRLPNLEPDQFWFALRLSGYESDLLTWIATFNDPEHKNYNPHSWAYISSRLEKATFFEIDNPLIEEAKGALGMTDFELEIIWKYAASM